VRTPHSDRHIQAPAARSSLPLIWLAFLVFCASPLVSRQPTTPTAA
jgi:hypothetical protein